MCSNRKEQVNTKLDKVTHRKKHETKHNLIGRKKAGQKKKHEQSRECNTRCNKVHKTKLNKTSRVMKI